MRTFPPKAFLVLLPIAAAVPFSEEARSKSKSLRAGGGFAGSSQQAPWQTLAVFCLNVRHEAVYLATANSEWDSNSESFSFLCRRKCLVNIWGSFIECCLDLLIVGSLFHSFFRHCQCLLHVKCSSSHWGYMENRVTPAFTKHTDPGCSPNNQT